MTDGIGEAVLEALDPVVEELVSTQKRVEHLEAHRPATSQKPRLAAG